MVPAVTKPIFSIYHGQFADMYAFHLAIVVALRKVRLKDLARYLRRLGMDAPSWHHMVDPGSWPWPSQ